jgi:tetratricopeptide (TPR) repeat protein
VELIDDRFELEAQAGSGGMGRVFRARDRQSGATVAVKMLLAEAGAHLARFEAEARTLSELSHPGIVTYVGHGMAASGQPYLAMEWLDGEDLESRLRKGPLRLDDCLTIAKGVAVALGAAHARGIVHRDLKPSNIFLVDGQVEQVKLLDFGIARMGGAARMTRAGMIVGTPGYMAPEQVQSEREVDARADVFSLGCVLFECVTGRAPFVAEHPMALLAKVIFADTPRLRELRPEATASLESLVFAMMAKDPSLRPLDGATVAAALETVALTTAAVVAPFALTRAERRTISVVLIAGEVTSAELATLEQAEADALSELGRRAIACGGRLWPLPGGSVAVSIGGTGIATDQASQAARCALALRGPASGRAMALATGRGDMTGRTATDEAIDRAAKMLAARCDASIAIDEMTARLLDGRFDVREGEAGLELHGERETVDGARLLLNKVTPCVGRDRELTTLSQIFAECLEEPRAQAALVKGLPGMGKSRVGQEFLARLRHGGLSLQVWTGRGDSLRAGSALGLLAQALRGACGIRGDEPLAERRARLVARVARHVPEQDRQRVAELLGEMIGMPFPDDESTLLRTARRAAQILNDEMRRAWIDFLRAETAAQPIVLVLEDMHWGDGATVRFIDAALRELSDRPWMVLALARPEVDELFPKLWAERHVHEVSLNPLGKKACERLVQHVLGGGIGGETAERIIAQADGNAFYLEELIRTAAEQQVTKLPETVIAMVQSRLAALDDEDRRMLRAAAVFGETFWSGGVAELLGEPEGAASVRERLLGLVEREVLVQRPSGHFESSLELSFRHALLREGAYAMLTADDRTTGHRLAGSWLERSGETDPRLLAAHFDRGDEAAKAAAYYRSAAEQALEGGDYGAAIALAARGTALTQEPEVIAGLFAVDADAKLQSGDLKGALCAGREVLGRARPGSRTEGRAIYAAVLAADLLRDTELIEEASEQLLRAEPEPDAIALLASGFFSVILGLIYQGQPRVAATYLQRVEWISAPVMDRDPLAVAWVSMARELYEIHVSRDAWSALQHSLKAVSAYQSTGLAGELSLGRLFMGMNYALLGLFDRAEEEFAAVRATNQAGSLHEFATYTQIAIMRLYQRRSLEAASLAAWVIRAVESRGELHFVRHMSLVGVHAQLLSGEIEAADAAIEALAIIDREEPHIRKWYLTVLAGIRLAQGRAAEASEVAERAYLYSQAHEMGEVLSHATLLLVRAEAREALGDHAGACAAIRDARDDLLRRAAKIPDPQVRRAFLENIPEHQQTLNLAQQWLRDDCDVLAESSSREANP